MEDIVIQLIISGCGVIGSILAVTVILAKMLGDAKKIVAAPPANGQKAINENVQRQIRVLETDSDKFITKYDDHVNKCTGRWMENSELKGNIDSYMSEIRDRLSKIEAKVNV